MTKAEVLDFLRVELDRLNEEALNATGQELGQIMGECFAVIKAITLVSQIDCSKGER